MRNLPGTRASAAPRSLAAWALTAIAVMTLSAGIGATTAVFALVEDASPHHASAMHCETMMTIADDPSIAADVAYSDAGDLQNQIADVYERSYESAGEAADSWRDSAAEIADPSSALFISVLGASALALLVLCARGAAALLARPADRALIVGASFGALGVATLVLRLFELPGIELRGVAFAVCVSMAAVYFVRATRGQSAALVD